MQDSAKYSETNIKIIKNATNEHFLSTEIKFWGSAGGFFREQWIGMGKAKTYPLC